MIDLRGANGPTAVCYAEVNAAVHSEIAAIPDERLIVEREPVQRLPRRGCRSRRHRCWATSTDPPCLR